MVFSIITFNNRYSIVYFHINNIYYTKDKYKVKKKYNSSIA